MEKNMESNVVKKDYIEYQGLKFHRRAHPEAYEMAFSLLKDAHRGLLLDLGAGSGYTSCRLGEMGFDVRAFDVNPGQFVPPGIPCLKADLNLPIGDIEPFSVDAVLALEIVEHLENTNAFLREIHRVLKPGGILLFSTPNIANLFSRFRFLFRTEFTHFCNRSYRIRDNFCDEATGHITPLLPWMIEHFLHLNHFEILKKHEVGATIFNLHSHLLSSNTLWLTRSVAEAPLAGRVVPERAERDVR